MLARRAAWRGHELEVRAARRRTTRSPPGEHDLFYVGGGQDREQALIAPDLALDRRRRCARPSTAARRCSPSAAATSCSAAATATRAARSCPGVGLLPARHGRRRAADDRRRAARVRARARRAPHARRLREPRRPHDTSTRARSRSAASLAGFGNDGESGYEGCRAGRAIGTYLHGPLAPAQPVARRLAARAGARAPHRRGAGARAARRRARGRGPRGLLGPSPLPRRPLLSLSRARRAREKAPGGWRLGRYPARHHETVTRSCRLCASSRRPESAEVDRRVARAPALQEALDRRVQDDLVELVRREQPVPADGCVLRRDRLERTAGRGRRRR